MQMDQRLTKFVQVGSRVFFFILVVLEHGQHSTDKSTSPKLLLGEKHKHSSSGRISGTFTVGSVKVRKLEITFVAVWLLNMLPCGVFPCFWLCYHTALNYRLFLWTSWLSRWARSVMSITASHCTWQYSNIPKEESMNERLYLPLSGSEKARPVHRVVLLQHPEAGHQPPAEVFNLLTSSHCRLAEILQPTPPPPVLLLQRLWGSALPPQRGERHVAVEAEVWAPRSGFSSHRRYSVTNEWKKIRPLNTSTSKCIFWGFQMPSQQWVHSLWKPMSSYSELFFFVFYYCLCCVLFA